MAVATGVLAPTTGSAQLEIGPLVGFYLPVGALVKEAARSSSSGPSEKHLGGTILVGGEGLFWVTKRVGVAASVAYAPSPIAVTDSFGTRDQIGAVFLTDARLIVPVTRLEAKWSLYLGAGAAVVSRSGAPWQYSSGATSPALVASLGVRLPLYGLGVTNLSPPPHFVMRMEVADYISRAQFDKGLPTQTTARSHQDFTFSLVVTYSIFRR